MHDAENHPLIVDPSNRFDWVANRARDPKSTFQLIVATAGTISAGHMQI